MNWHHSSARCHTRSSDDFLESAKVRVFLNECNAIISTIGSPLVSVMSAFLLKMIIDIIERFFVFIEASGDEM